MRLLQGRSFRGGSAEVRVGFKTVSIRICFERRFARSPLLFHQRTHVARPHYLQQGLRLYHGVIRTRVESGFYGASGHYTSRTLTSYFLDYVRTDSGFAFQVSGFRFQGGYFTGHRGAKAAWCSRQGASITGSAPRGPRRKPGASYYTLTSLSPSLSISLTGSAPAVSSFGHAQLEGAERPTAKAAEQGSGRARASEGGGWARATATRF